VKRVIRETADAVSFVFDVPPDLFEVFSYRAGQFVTLKLCLEGEDHVRSYSMSSSPGIDDDLQVTVKRVPGGLVSNWLNDHVVAGSVLHVNPPGGAFTLESGDREIVAFAAGSGITPVFSILKRTLAESDSEVRLLYANRDRESAIFVAQLDELASWHPDRFTLVHHFDVDRGFVGFATITSFLNCEEGADVFVCGPAPFMEIVEHALDANHVPSERVHIERFTPADDEPAGDADDIEIVITLGRQTARVAHRANTTILHAARSAGLSAPSSCESGNCATCMARVTEGAAHMRNNEALSPDEVADGWILTCQALPITPVVEVVYE
jgi:ferredoxin-NADP reductase